VWGGLEWPDPAHQPVLEPQIVGEPAEQRLTEMDVGLDETRDDQTAAAITDRQGRGFAVRPSRRQADRLNPSVPHGDIRPFDSPLAVVQQHIAAGEEQVGGFGV